MRKVILIGIISLIIASQCSLKLPSESDLPSWSVDLEIPLASESITIDELLEDSTIIKLPYGGGSDSIFAFADDITIDEIRVGNRLNIDDITQTIEQGIDEIKVEHNSKKFSNAFEEVGVDAVGKQTCNRIGLITLDDTDPQVTNPITLAEIVDLSGVPEGSNTIINQSTAFPSIDRQVTFSEFDWADFTSGELEIKISNDLVVELGAPLRVELLNASTLAPIVGSDGDSAIAVWSTGILPGQNATATISLAQKAISGDLVVRVKGFLCGSAPANITNNSQTRSSAFTIEVRARHLEVTTAVAQIPEQTIDSTNVIALDPTEPNKVANATIRQGRLGIRIENLLPVAADLILTINSLKTASSGGTAPFTATLHLPAKTVTQHEYPLVEDILTMDISAQEIQYNYLIHTLPTDPQKVTLNSDDSIKVAIDIYGTTPGTKITFSAIEGLIEPQDISESGEINTSSDALIRVAEIASGYLNLNIDNGINQSASDLPHLQIEIPEITDQNGQSLKLQIDLNPGMNNHSLSLNNYKITPLSQPITLDSTRQYITYRSRVTTQGGQLAQYNLVDSIDVNLEISDITFQSVTGFFHQDAIVSDEVIELQEKTKLATADIMNGNLILTLTNHIGVIASVDFTVDELLNRTTGAKFNQRIQLLGDATPVVVTIPLKDYRIVLPYTDLNTNQLIHYTSRVSIPSDQEMTITANEKIDVAVNLADLEFNRVQGYIEPVQIDLEKVEQEISALPEELEGINLRDVDMQIEFETDIGVPVELNLNITAKAANGDSVRREIKQVITTNPILIVPDAEDLINIKPKTIIASGYALVGGEGVVDTAQYVKGKMHITVPLEMEIKPGAKVDLEPSLVTADIPEQIEKVTIYADIQNELELGGTATILAAKDTLLFAADSAVGPDTLTVIDLYPDSSFLAIVQLPKEKIVLFEDSIYTKVVVGLLGKVDGSGNPMPSRFMPGQKLNILLRAQITGLVEFAEKND